MTNVNYSDSDDVRKDEWHTMVTAVVHRINALCEQKDMSIYELAKLSGVSQSTLNEIMQGRSERPRIDTIKKIAFGFSINLHEFFDDPVFDKIVGVDDQEPPQRIKKRRKSNETETN
jgi:transcriptional regulator with XRE-family HTH domain